MRQSRRVMRVVLRRGDDCRHTSFLDALAGVLMCAKPRSTRSLLCCATDYTPFSPFCPEHGRVTGMTHANVYFIRSGSRTQKRSNCETTSQKHTHTHFSGSEKKGHFCTHLEWGVVSRQRMRTRPTLLLLALLAAGSCYGKDSTGQTDAGKGDVAKGTCRDFIPHTVDTGSRCRWQTSAC